jgi:hypothetical protein
MRGYSTMSDEERQQIIKQHAQVYDGYAIGNVPSNMTPLTVYDAARDKEGVTVNSFGDVKHYTNHKINEIAAKNLHYDEIDPAYEFDSGGPGDPNLGYNVYNQTKPAYNFNSKGPVDVFEDDFVYNPKDPGCVDDEDEEENVEDLEDLGDDELNENVHKTLDMFKRFKKYN